MTVYRDLGDHSEAERIQAIGEAAMVPGQLIAFIVEKDVPGKADRYIKRLLDRFPALEVVERLEDVPFGKMVTVKVRRKAD